MTSSSTASTSSHTTQAPNLGLYFHWPFCEKKCPYCDFNSHVRQKIDDDAWTAAYLRSLDYYTPYIAGRPITSIFFGGGTPSLAAPRMIGHIIDKIAAITQITSATEITIEANPGSTEMGKMAAFRTAGINRISLGVQSLHDHHLRFLGRKHSAAEARQALEIAAALYPNHSFDLIYGLPDQETSAWQHDLEEAVNLGSPHLSLYQLTIEPGTAFHAMWRRGDLQLPDEDKLADFYTITADITAKHNLRRYEVSNHARPGYESQHNLRYWRYQDYLGIGPGAHGRLHNTSFSRGLVQIFNPLNLPNIPLIHSATSDISPPVLPEKLFTRLATTEIRTPEKWLSTVQERGCGIAEIELIDATQANNERILMGLRLLEEGLSLENTQTNHEKITELTALGLIEQWNDHTGLRIKATALGAPILDAVVSNLLL